jgi:hypothetical protein
MGGDERMKALLYTVLLLLWAGVPVCRAGETSRPRFPYMAELSLEGIVRSASNVVVGRFIEAAGKHGSQVGRFRCDRVLKGPLKKGKVVTLKSRRIAWRCFDDSSDLLVAWPLRPMAGQGEAVGAKAKMLARTEDILAAEARRPVGNIVAIGVHLERLEDERGRLRFEYQAKNYSTCSWTVNVDRKVSARPKSHHRAVSLRIINVQKEEAARTLQERRAACVYQSERPWIGRSVMETARTGSRPDRPIAGATVRLPPGASFRGRVELRPTGKPDEYQACINGHRDLGPVFRLTPSRHRIVLCIDDDYHYYTGNGTRIRQRDYWYGLVRSNPIEIDLRREQ